ncbi:AAA family ATPase [Butyricimonas virosa]|jgi:predicted ATP-binding protein involved in virulence|uniref:AAA family ATPase n=1 Tax=Butyricimonas virosa TaxID=544645 RepID=UPI00241C7AF8|nr:AAA family ATPase [Butyricimonas virosa]MCI7293706.1 AAA family ATPase [Butyricimonas virosa]
MDAHIDFSKLKTSWTKYDIVQALDVVYSVETIQRFLNKEIGIDEPILRSFLGIRSLKDPIPMYWIEIQEYIAEKKIFALLALIFTHGGIVNEFATKYSTGNMKGVFKMEPGKQYTNIRSALVESGAAAPYYRRQETVSYDISIVFYNPAIGKLFKCVLIERLSRLTKKTLSNEEFYEECFYNNFHKALGVNQKQFKAWLEGIPFDSHYINRVVIDNFFSIKEIDLDFQDSKEIYFLGENGDGKSLILMALYLAFNGNYITTKTDQEETGKAVDILRKNKSSRLRGYDEFDKEYNPQQANYIENIYAYGTHRGRYSSDTPEEYGFMSLFDFNKTLNDPITWLKNQKLLELESLHNEEESIGFRFATDELENMFYELLEKNVKVEIQGTDVYFVEKGYKLSFEQLSEGYRSIVIFVCDVLYRLSANIEKNKDLKSIKGVVLVDEIDLHLHPKWQQVIIKRLRSLLPNIQFFFTTHSATIIQGASNDAIVYRVYRENGETKVSEPYLRKDLNHLMINTLLTSPLFGLGDSRLDTNNEYANTDDSYFLYKINNQLKNRLEAQKKAGKNFISDKEIDDIITSIINEELKK